MYARLQDKVRTGNVNLHSLWALGLYECACKQQCTRPQSTCLHRVEQAYIDAYEGEGWKGANREKLKPDGDLKQAHLRVSGHLDLQCM